MVTRILSRKFFNEYVNGLTFLDNPSFFSRNLQGHVMENQRVQYEVQIGHSVDTKADGVTLEMMSGNVFKRSFGSFIDDGWFSGQQVELIDHAGVANETSVFTADITFVGATTIGLTITSGSGVEADYTNHILVGLDVPQYVHQKFEILENGDAPTFTGQGFYGQQGTTFTPRAPFSSQYGDLTITYDSSTTDFAAGGNWLHTYTITHDFTIPFFEEDTRGDNPPANFILANCLKYIAEFEFRYDLNNPNEGLLFEDTETIGATGWYDEMFNGLANPYSITALNYPSSTALINGTQTKLTFTVMGSGFSIATKIGGYHGYTPSVIDPAKDYRDNHLFDRLYCLPYGVPVIAGGAEEVQTITATLVSATQIDVEMEILASPVDITDGYVVGLQVGDAVGNRVILEVDRQEYFQDPDVTGLLTYNSLTHHPHYLGEIFAGKTNYNGYVEDGVMTSFQFDLDTNFGATLADLELQFIAYKDESTQFLIQRVPFDLSGIINVNATTPYQMLSLEDTRGFDLADGNMFNYLQLSSNVPTLGIQEWNGKIGWRIDYQSWKELEGADTIFFDNTKEFNGLNKNSSNYMANGYSLKVAIVAGISSGNTITDYRHLSQDVIAGDYDSSSWTQTTETFDEDGNALNGKIQADKPTVFRIDWFPPSTPFLLFEVWAHHRLHVGDRIYELSSIKDTYTGNPLTNELTDAPYLEVEVLTDRVRTTCTINPSVIEEGVTYRLSGRLGEGDADPPLVGWTSSTFVGGATGRFDLLVGELLREFTAPDPMTDGSALTISVLKVDKIYNHPYPDLDISCYKSGDTYDIGHNVFYQTPDDLGEIRAYQSTIMQNPNLPSTGIGWTDMGVISTTTLETLTGDKNTTAFGSFVSVLLGGATVSVLTHMNNNPVINFGTTLEFDKKDWAVANGFDGTDAITLLWVIQGVESLTGLSSNQSAIAVCTVGNESRYQSAFTSVFVNAEKTESISFNSTNSSYSSGVIPMLRHAYHANGTHEIIKEEAIDLTARVYSFAYSNLVADFGEMVNGYPVVYFTDHNGGTSTDFWMYSITKNAGSGWTTAIVWQFVFGASQRASAPYNLEIDYACRSNGKPLLRLCSRSMYLLGNWGDTFAIYYNGANWVSQSHSFYGTISGVYDTTGANNLGSGWFPQQIVTDVNTGDIYVYFRDDGSAVGGASKLYFGKMAKFTQTLGSTAVVADRINHANWTFQYLVYLNSGNTFNQDGTGAGTASDGNLYFAGGIDIIDYDANGNPVFVTSHDTSNANAAIIKRVRSTVATPTSGADWVIESPMAMHDGNYFNKSGLDVFQRSGYASATEINGLLTRAEYDQFAFIDENTFLWHTSQHGFIVKVQISDWAGGAKNHWRVIAPSDLAYTGTKGNVLKETY
jgi:hypothetical protein